jgi:transcriptional regulator with XRE-family HTH domain
MATKRKIAAWRRAAKEERRFIREVAKAIAQMRAFNGLLQGDVAILAGDSQAGISRIERGIERRAPNWAQLRRISSALGWHMKVVFSDAAGPLVEVEKPSPRRRKIKAPPRPQPPRQPYKELTLADLEPWGMD